MADRPAYLLLLASAIERRRFADYVGAVTPQLLRHGGQPLALAPSPTVEYFGHHDMPRSVMVSRWNSSDHLHAFWQSPAHQQIASRPLFGEFLAVAVEGASIPGAAAAGEVLAIFLGAGPSPALLEAEGARALALVREQHVHALEGHWTAGDVAIYSWASARNARHQLLQLSSGQRGRALLVPALASTPAPPALSDDSVFADAAAA